jgi:hypothetical protein
MNDELGYIEARIRCLNEDIRIAENEIEELEFKKKHF